MLLPYLEKSGEQKAQHLCLQNFQFHQFLLKTHQQRDSVE